MTYVVVSDQRDRNGDHADNRKAENGVEGNRPSHVPEHRPEEHGAKDDERHRVEHFSEFLDQMPDLAAVPSPDGAEDKTSNKRGDKPGAADRICDSESKAGPGQRHDLEPGATDVPAPTGDRDDERRGDARNNSREDGVADLLEHQPNRSPSPIAPDSAWAIASTIQNNGTQMPSLRPLSTFRPCRTRLGSLVSVTTA